MLRGENPEIPLVLTAPPPALLVSLVDPGQCLQPQTLCNLRPRIQRVLNSRQCWSALGSIAVTMPEGLV